MRGEASILNSLAPDHRMHQRAWDNEVVKHGAMAGGKDRSDGLRIKHVKKTRGTELIGREVPIARDDPGTADGFNNRGKDGKESEIPIGEAFAVVAVDGNEPHSSLHHPAEPSDGNTVLELLRDKRVLRSKSAAIGREQTDAS